jgi:hypothetical protein
LVGRTEVLATEREQESATPTEKISMTFFQAGLELGLKDILNSLTP